ncbi:MAG: CopD family protein [Pseudomarimonas sp.]
MAYLWIKTFHLLFVIAWMACVFYLPRILINMVEAGGEAAVQARLVVMGQRLYRFGHVMFGLALVLGITLVVGYRLWGGWLHAKLALVGVLLALFIVSGRMLKRAAAGGSLPSTRSLRWFNELPVLVTVAVIYLVLAKPF